MQTPQTKPGEVLVEVKACDICGSDLHFYLWELTAPQIFTSNLLSAKLIDVNPLVTYRGALTRRQEAFDLLVKKQGIKF